MAVEHVDPVDLLDETDVRGLPGAHQALRHGKLEIRATESEQRRVPFEERARPVFRAPRIGSGESRTAGSGDERRAAVKATPRDDEPRRASAQRIGRRPLGGARRAKRLAGARGTSRGESAVERRGDVDA
ncbi:MAG: hypothetical protein Kow0062_00740 [Acidobacteriota bacterium]